MANKKDELISGSELARRINTKPQYITKQKAKLKDAKCMFGNKYYYEKSCNFLGKNPDDPHKSRQSNLQTNTEEPESNENWTVAAGKENIDKVVKSLKPKKNIKVVIDDLESIEEPNDVEKRMAQCGVPEDESKSSDSEAKNLLEQILESIKDGNSSANRTKLDLLRQKAGVLREYFTAKNEEIKNRKLEENLFEKDEVIQILSFAMNMIRNSLINLPNNYAVNIDGLNQKEIKEYVTDDVNKILEDLQNIGNQFE